MWNICVYRMSVFCVKKEKKQVQIYICIRLYLQKEALEM